MVEFGSLLEQYVTDSSSLLIIGDFNLYVDNNLDKSSQDFLALIDSFYLKQHECSPTYRAGHIFDLIITRDDDQLVTSVSIHDAAFSDHFVVNGTLSMEKPLFTKKPIIYRSYKNFDIDLFISDIRGSSLISDPPNELHDLVTLYDSELSGVFNRHVPIKKRTVTIRPAAPWYSEELKSEKREKRQLERRWRASRSMRDREAYTRQCKVLKDLLCSSRSNYYSNLVAENQSNMRSLFAVFSKLLHRRHEAKYPKHDSSSSLANDFVLFFGDKMRRIRRDLDQVPPLDTAVDNGTTGCQLNMFSTVSPD